METIIIPVVILTIMLIIIFSSLNSALKDYDKKLFEENQNHILKEIVKQNNTVNEMSFQKYAKFYGNTVLIDSEFENKINKIYDLIVNKKYTSLEEIAGKSNCTLEECVLKIKYLKNKKIIGDYFIDHLTKEIKKCSKEDRKLISKYSPFIYGKHFQIDEIATHLPGTTINNRKKVEEQIYKELRYLDDKDLINGVIINDVDKTIKYYSIEKKLKAKDFVSMQCEYCGALNDVRRGNKTRCEYCNSIIENKENVI